MQISLTLQPVLRRMKFIRVLVQVALRTRIRTILATTTSTPKDYAILLSDYDVISAIRKVEQKIILMKSNRFDSF